MVGGVRVCVPACMHVGEAVGWRAVQAAAAAANANATLTAYCTSMPRAPCTHAPLLPSPASRSVPLERILSRAQAHPRGRNENIPTFLTNNSSFIRTPTTRNGKLLENTHLQQRVRASSSQLQHLLVQGCQLGGGCRGGGAAHCGHGLRGRLLVAPAHVVLQGSGRSEAEREGGSLLAVGMYSCLPIAPARAGGEGGQGM